MRARWLKGGSELRINLNAPTFIYAPCSLQRRNDEYLVGNLRIAALQDAHDMAVCGIPLDTPHRSCGVSEVEGAILSLLCCLLRALCGDERKRQITKFCELSASKFKNSFRLLIGRLLMPF